VSAILASISVPFTVFVAWEYFFTSIALLTISGLLKSVGTGSHL
jgi:hypothetical protein